jgi:hypothetical protein
MGKTKSKIKKKKSKIKKKKRRMQEKAIANGTQNSKK